MKTEVKCLRKKRVIGGDREKGEGIGGDSGQWSQCDVFLSSAQGLESVPCACYHTHTLPLSQTI